MKRTAAEFTRSSIAVSLEGGLPARFTTATKESFVRSTARAWRINSGRSDWW